jgi:hypothetical protein
MNGKELAPQKRNRTPYPEIGKQAVEHFSPPVRIEMIWPYAIWSFSTEIQLKV